MGFDRGAQHENLQVVNVRVHEQVKKSEMQRERPVKGIGAVLNR
jgi:hypothetical protein